MSIQFMGLSPALFQPLLALDPQQLRERGIRRMTCEASPGMPCRVSLQDAQVGESVLLLNYFHHEVATPYRASGPIYVRTAAIEPFGRRNTVPEVLLTRLLSLRAYDAKGYLRDADAVDGAALQPVLERLLDVPKVAYVQIHFAKTGCYACEARAAAPLPSH